MRIARISGKDALYGASVSARTSEASAPAILNPIYFDDVDVNLANETMDLKFPHAKGYNEFVAKSLKVANMVNFAEENKRSVNRELTPECEIRRTCKSTGNPLDSRYNVIKE